MQETYYTKRREFKNIESADTVSLLLDLPSRTGDMKISQTWIWQQLGYLGLLEIYENVLI